MRVRNGGSDVDHKRHGIDEKGCGIAAKFYFAGAMADGESAAGQPQPNLHHEGQKSTKENHPDGPIQYFVLFGSFVVREFSQK